MTTLMEFLGSPLAHGLLHALGWTLLHFLWQGAIVAVILWCALQLLTGRSSQARYLAACLAFLVLVTLPLITFARLAAAAVKSGQTTWDAAIAIDPAMMLQVAAGDIVAPWPARMAVALDHRMPWLLAVWLVGAIFFVARLNYGLRVASRLKSAGTETTTAEFSEMFDCMKYRIGIKRAVRLLHSARVQVPTVIGWLRPVVLIPASCLTGLSTAQIAAIFCHELAHVRRHDYLVSVFQSIAEALLFYHPAVWWISKQVRRERECCCDEIAVANGGDVLAYAKALSFLEERRASFPEFVLGANGGVLSMRIKRLLGYKSDTQASQFAAYTLLVLMITVAGSYIATTARAQAKTVAPIIAIPLHAVGLIQEQANPQGSRDAQGSDRKAETVSLASIRYQPQSSVESHTGAAPSSSSAGGDRPDMSCTFYDSKSQGHAGACEGTPGVEASYSCRSSDDPRPSQRQTGCGWKVQRMRDWELANHVDVPSSVEVPQIQRVPSRLVEGMIVSKVEPEYPHIARAAHVQGVVTLNATISKTGDVESLHVLSGPAMLTASAMDAVRQWKFKPYLLNGKATEVDTTINVNFALAEPKGSTEAPRPSAEPSNGPGGVPSEYNGAPLRRIGSGVSSPVVIYQVEPEFSEEATKAKFMGMVLVTLIVDQNGTPQNVHVLRGVGMGLDEKAVAAIKQYKFKPAIENGKPVPVALNVEVNFQIFDKPRTVPAATEATKTVPTIAVNVLPSFSNSSSATPPDLAVRKIGGAVSTPVVISSVSPEYSPEARKAKTEGTVLVNLIVNQRGLPQNVHVVRGLPNGLDERAVEAVRQYRFKPAMEDGKPVRVELNIEVTFKFF